MAVRVAFVIVLKDFGLIVIDFVLVLKSCSCELEEGGAIFDGVLLFEAVAAGEPLSERTAHFGDRANDNVLVKVVGIERCGIAIFLEW